MIAFRKSCSGQSSSSSGGRLFELAACVRLCPVGRLDPDELDALRRDGMLPPDWKGRYVPVSCGMGSGRVRPLLRVCL